MKTGKALLPAMLALLTFAAMAVSQASLSSPSIANAKVEERGVDALIRYAKKLFHFASIKNEKP